MTVMPHRDPTVAGFERLAQLEDEVRRLRDELAPRPTPPRRRHAWLIAIAIAGAATLGGVLVAFSFLGRPSSQTVLRTNQGIAFTVHFRGEVRDVELSTLDGTRLPLMWPAEHVVEASDRSTRYLGDLGDPAPEPQPQRTLASTRAVSALLPRHVLAQDGPTRLRVDYRYWGFARHAEVELDARSDGDRALRTTLEGMPTQWVAFRDYNGQLLLYFTTMLAYKPTIAAIHWGLDGEGLDHEVRFRRSSELGIDNDDEVYTAIPHGTRAVRVQITWNDGSKSAVTTIRRDDATIR